MKIRATAFGEYHGKRKPGTVFEFEGKPSGKWMEPVDDAARAAFKKAGIKFAPKVEPLPLKEEKTALSGDVIKDPPDPGASGGSTGDKNVI
jgi:hypothetical protein